MMNGVSAGDREQQGTRLRRTPEEVTHVSKGLGMDEKEDKEERGAGRPRSLLMEPQSGPEAVAPEQEWPQGPSPWPLPCLSPRPSRETSISAAASLPGFSPCPSGVYSVGPARPRPSSLHPGIGSSVVSSSLRGERQATCPGPAQRQI